MKTKHFYSLIFALIFLVPAKSSARWLSPETGRFMTMDTYAGTQQDPQSLHKYLYTEDNPVNLTDPSGLDPNGHHYVPRAISRKYSERVREFWDEDPDSRLDAKDYVSHNGKSYNDISPQEYKDTVQDKLDDYLKSKGKTSPEDLTDQELKDFVRLIKGTKEGPIAEYNEGVAEEILETTAEGARAIEITEIADVAFDVDVVVIDVGVTLR